MSGPVEYASLFSTAHTQPENGDIKLFSTAYLMAVQQDFERKCASASLDIEFSINPEKVNNTCAWAPETGMAWDAARENRLAEAALQLGLSYARLGMEGRIKAELAGKAHLFFEGYLWEASGVAELIFSGEKITFEMKKNKQKISWTRKKQNWKLEDMQYPSGNPFLNWVPAVEADESYSSYIVYPEFIGNEQHNWPVASDTLSYAVNQVQRDASEIRVAQNYIRTFAPRCVNWVEKITRGILLQDNLNPGAGASYSSFLRPGLVGMDNNACAELYGEMLVHESSHQYLNLCKLLGGLVNDRDKQLYYSPLKRKSRPLEAVLYAAHAQINMLLYHAEAIKNGANPKTHIKAIQFLVPAFLQTHEPLANTVGLTDLARSVYDISAAEVQKYDFSWVEKQVA